MPSPPPNAAINGAFFAQQAIGNLKQDSSTVTGQRVGADRAPMVQIDQYL